KLASLADDPDQLHRYIAQTVAQASDDMGPQSHRLLLVGGSWRAIARIDMHRRGYPLQVLHEYRMTADDVAATADLIAQSDPNDLRQPCGISAGRMALVPLAIPVLQAVVAKFAPFDIAISSYGIREGLLYEQMPQKMRNRDPLIEACRHAEAKDARRPGFGKRLAKFIAPLFPKAHDDLRRLIKAACLMHDVNWRAHPDYRAEVCFDTVTRANLGGIKHNERVFLGTALMYRYRNTPEGTRFEELITLLTQNDATKAEILGKAMRLGAMLWDDTDPASLGIEQGTLSLNMAPTSLPLNGEVVEARLASLARTMGLAYQITA
ncbi:MAG: exopolyphosphatase, partial [Pseudomonadota bacterium]